MPLSTIGDGNCAYRAGTEDLHPYVQLMAAIEMIEHSEFYDVKSPSFIQADNCIVTSQYSVLVKDAGTSGSYAEMIHLYAISAAFGVTIQSYIPPSACVGLAASPYTTVIAGRDVRRTTSPAFTLMWSTRCPTAASPTFNHIVPLVARSTSEPLDDDDDRTFDYAAARPSDSIATDVNAPDSSESETSREVDTSEVLDDVDNEPLADDTGVDVDNTSPAWISLHDDFLTTAEVMNYLQHPPAGEICSI